MPVVVGAAEGSVNAKLPDRFAPPIPVAFPPVSVELPSAWPSRIELAFGGVVMVGVPLAMSNVRTPGAEPAELETVALVEKFPAVAGVPEIAPVVALSVSPAGKALDAE